MDDNFSKGARVKKPLHSTLSSNSVVVTGEKKIDVIDSAQDHYGHFCFHQHMMRDQLIVQELECGQDHGDG